MCSRAERKRRRRAADRERFEATLRDVAGAWVIRHPSRGGSVAGLRDAIQRLADDAAAKIAPGLPPPHVEFVTPRMLSEWTTVPLALAFDALKDHAAIDTTGEPVPEVTQTPKSAAQIIDETMAPILRDLARRPSPFAIDTTGEDVTDVRRLPSKEPT